MLVDLQTQIAKLTQRLEVQNLEDHIDDHDFDFNFKSSFHNCALFWEHRVHEEQQEDLGLRVDLPKFPGTLQAKGFIDLLHDVECIYNYEEDDFEEDLGEYGVSWSRFYVDYVELS